MWLKIPLEEADKIVNLPPELIRGSVQIDATADIRDYLIYETVDNFVYVYKMMFDLPGKNRDLSRVTVEQQEKEIDLWNLFRDNNGFEEVAEVPRREM